jgi:glycosyltransferase involved in cell wall biosynthesis
MRLGIDASNLRGGGGVTHLVGLLEAAQPREHDISEIIVWGGKRTIAQLPQRPWLRPVEEPLLNGLLPARIYWRMLRLPRLARDQCDVLLTPGGGLGKSTKPVVTMFRNMLPFEPTERRRYGWSWMSLRLMLLRPVQLNGFRHAAGVIFLNEYARSKVAPAIGSSDGLAVIPHGIDDSFRSPPRPQRPITSYSTQAPFRLLYVSIVDVYKHQWSVARAVAMLRREGLPVAIDFYGPAYPPALHRLERVLEEVDPKRDFIRYRGPAKPVDLPELYRSTDAFVFASTCENMPNIVIEAMAAGLPIASSNRAPMPEVLGLDGGVYFNPEEPSSIAAAVRTLVTDCTRRAHIARMSYDRAQAFSWERCARETLDFVATIGRSARLT